MVLRLLISIAGLLNLSTNDILDGIILLCGDWPVCCRYLAASLASVHWMPAVLQEL